MSQLVWACVVSVPTSTRPFHNRVMFCCEIQHTSMDVSKSRKICNLTAFAICMSFPHSTSCFHSCIAWWKGLQSRLNGYVQFKVRPLCKTSIKCPFSLASRFTRTIWLVLNPLTRFYFIITDKWAPLEEMLREPWTLPWDHGKNSISHILEKCSYIWII